jgi:hypothetical protein
MLNIPEIRARCKARLHAVPKDALVLFVLVLASGVSFGLGYLSGVTAGQGALLSESTAPLSAATTSDSVVASKGGTKFYLPWCSGAARISDANKVWFASPADALAHGYTPASNCTGL